MGPGSSDIRWELVVECSLKFKGKSVLKIQSGILRGEVCQLHKYVNSSKYCQDQENISNNSYSNIVCVTVNLAFGTIYLYREGCDRDFCGVQNPAQPQDHSRGR